MNKVTSTAKHRQGLVIAYFGNSVAVEATNGQVFQCHLKRNQALPVVGDRVIWEVEDESGQQSGIIVSIEPRSTILVKGDLTGHAKPLAANIDKIFIVMAPVPIFSNHLVNRYLVAAELLHIQPVIVVNKHDLMVGQTKSDTLSQLNDYANVSYPTLLTSIYEPDSLIKLAACLTDQTAVLVGPSGVGKSSLIKALGCEDAIRIGEVSAKGSGKHTTTATRLYRLPQGGHLIDSPGVREFNLWPVSKKEIMQSFPEFQPYLTGCKFRDCSHLVEPDCAVQKAVKDGNISSHRYLSFQMLLKQAKN